MKFKCYKCR